MRSEKSLQPWEMSYQDFCNEFITLSLAVTSKEEKGRLNPELENYEPLSDKEREMLERDWRELSRARGYSEDEIQEYERWLLFCGRQYYIYSGYEAFWKHDPQRDVLLPHTLYMIHIEYARRTHQAVSKEAEYDYVSLKDHSRMLPIKARIKPNKKGRVLKLVSNW